MKVTVKQQPEEFKHVTLEITLETKEELEILYQLGNHGGSIERHINNYENAEYKINNLVSKFYDLNLPNHAQTQITNQSNPNSDNAGNVKS